MEAAETIKSVYLSQAAKRYITDLTRRTRQSSDIYLGASPRGTLGLARACQAYAALQGRDYVLPDDVKDLAIPVLAHRIIVSPEARLRELGADRIIQDIIHAIPVPGGSFQAPSMEVGTIKIEMNPGRILVALMILGGLIGSLAGGPAFYSHMLYLGLLLFFGAWLWTFFLARSFRIERNSDAQRGNVGDIFKERFDINNGSRLPALWVEIKNATPISASGSRLITMLRARQKQSYAVRMWLTRRGGFPLGPTIVTISDPLGLFRVTEKNSKPQNP